MALTQVQYGMQDPGLQGTPYSFKNRIINGDMRIDQRATSASSITVNSASRTYGPDRWYGFGQATDGVFTFQQSLTAPAGFKYSSQITVTTADASIGATQEYLFGQIIEGLNLTDLAWGTTNAQPVTLSFWIRASVTGTYGGALANSNRDRAYPFRFTINVVNTWEYKTITVTGDTTGTWVTDNGAGLRVDFCLGAGSSYVGTAGSWSAGAYGGVTGQTMLMSTVGATMYITGVQLEKGSTATNFDYRSNGTELTLSQRYYCNSFATGVAPANGVSYTTNAVSGVMGAYTTFAAYINSINFPVTLRVTPSMTFFSLNLIVSPTANQWLYYINGGSWISMSTTTPPTINQSAFSIIATGSWTANTAVLFMGAWQANAEF